MNKFEMKKIVLVLLLVMVGSFMAAGLLGSRAVFLGRVPGFSDFEDLDLTHEFPIAETTRIVLETISSDINVIPSDGETIKVHLYGSATRNILENNFARQAGNEISVRIKPRPGLNITTQFRLTLDVYVPPEFTGIIKLTTVSGNAAVSGLAVDELQFASVSGDLRAKPFDARVIGMKTTSGNLSLSGLTGNLSATTVSGSISAMFTTLKDDVSIHTTSGDTKLTLPADSAFELRLDTVSGRVTSEIPMSVSRSERTLYQGTAGEGKNGIRVRSVSGDVSIIQVK